MSVCVACNGCGWIDDDEIDETPPPVRAVEIPSGRTLIAGTACPQCGHLHAVAVLCDGPSCGCRS